MIELIRRFRGLGVALVVLAISAGAVFAGNTIAQLTVPTSPTTAEEPTEGTDTDTDEDADEDTGTDEDADADADADAPDNHGGLVSEAAKMETPEGFVNHGAFVSCVAHMKDGSLATVVWAEITVESCAAAREAAQAEKAAAKAEKVQAAKDKAAAAKAKGAEKAAAGKAKGKARRG